jgi:hypothetical protein
MQRSHCSNLWGRWIQVTYALNVTIPN